MSSIGTGYDLSAAQFSPDGRVFQIEYPSKAVENSTTIIGLRGKNGVVLAVEKIMANKLIETTSNKRIYKIDQHIGMAVAGLLADGMAIVDIAREEAENFRRRNNRPIPLKILNERLSSYMHAYTLYSAVRPFGVSVILASCTNETFPKPEMYMIEPSGASYGYFGCANGKSKQPAKTEIEKIKDLASLDQHGLVLKAATIINQVRDESKDKCVLEIQYVGKETNYMFENLNQALLEEANREATHERDDGETS